MAQAPPERSTKGGFDRRTMLDRLRAETFDILVIGGGITGTGTALDAATRGLRTALVERDDFASGTSSKSSKLIHGGLRYLQQRDVRLVYEALAERQRLRHLAPHLVRVLPFMIPILTRDGVMNAKVARALGSALWMYDVTGGARIGKVHRRLKKDAALAHMPTLPADRLASAYLYYDARADDARLCLTVARTAAAHGAVVLNGARVTALRKDGGRASGAIVHVDGSEVEVRASVVINATGVWADDVRALDEGAHPDSIRPAKGIHVTVPWDKVRNDIAVVIPVPKDKRSLFVVPWSKFTYVGTTDTDYDGPIDDPRCTSDDIAYVLRALNHSVSTRITESDITGVWAGLRPLVKSAGTARTADLSRKHQVRTSAAGMITVTGGKLTTYRLMAADAVDEAIGRLGRQGRSTTKRVRLLGADGYEEPDGDDRRAHLLRRYGTLASEVEAIIATDTALARPLVPGLPYLEGEAVYAVRHEMARNLDDVLSRRTRARLLDRAATVRAVDDVARLLAPELGWDDAEVAAQATAFRAALAHEAANLTLGAADDALDASLGA